MPGWLLHSQERGTTSASGEVVDHARPSVGHQRKLLFLLAGGAAKPVPIHPLVPIAVAADAPLLLEWGTYRGRAGDLDALYNPRASHGACINKSDLMATGSRSRDPRLTSGTTWPKPARRPPARAGATSRPVTSTPPPTPPPLSPPPSPSLCPLPRSGPNGTASRSSGAGRKFRRRSTAQGSQVYIEGACATRKWQDKQGNERYRPR